MESNGTKEQAYGILRKLTREHVHEIWKLAKSEGPEVLPDPESRQLARILLDHEDEYGNQFEIADFLGDHEFNPDTEENPFLHITIHQAVESQLDSKDPIEAYQFYNSMRNKKLSHHEAVHLIGILLSHFIFITMKELREFDSDRYRGILKRLKSKKPDKVPAAIENEFETEL